MAARGSSGRTTCACSRVTGGYHRYFSHRSYKLNRFWQFCLAFLAQTSGQKGVLWWAAHHRDHHLHSDRKDDLHSPVHEGFWWSHLGWILSDEYDDYDPKRIADFSAATPSCAGSIGSTWCRRSSTPSRSISSAAGPRSSGASSSRPSLLYHGTFLINSLAHIWGTRRFATPDESRNNFVLALVTLGEGWHNNHHHFMSSVRQGIRWWEVDITYYMLRDAVVGRHHARPAPVPSRRADADPGRANATA